MTHFTPSYSEPREAAGIWLLAFLIVVVGTPMTASAQQNEALADVPFDPPAYLVYRAPAPIEVDGALDETAWQRAEWTEPFVDIRGGERPAPELKTRAKMLWDDRYFYVAAELEEPEVWATRTERDAVIFRDDAFEVFIDPTGDTHNYYELEVNALETPWDLLLVKPSRDDGVSLDAWTIQGLEVGVQVKGTLNDPTDTDEGWTVELALPWAVLEEAAPEERPPRPGEQWRVNFARPDWPMEVVNETYQKEENASAQWWTWAPQSAVNMHMPERFGYAQFAGEVVGQGSASFVEKPNEQVKWALRRLYYRQRDYHDVHGRYASDLAELEAGEISVEGGDIDFEPTLQVTQSSYEITSPGADGTTVHIRHDGKVWTTSD